MEITLQSSVEAAQKVAATEDGKILIAYLVRKFGYVSKSMMGAEHGLEHAEGQRSTIVHLDWLLSVDPFTLNDMTEKEHAE